MLILIIIYIVSVYGSYKFIQIAHSKGGIWEVLNPNLLDIFMTIMPFFNTGFSIMYLLGYCYEIGHIKRKKLDLSRFYLDLSKFYKVTK
jgi:hypothetical protein